MSGSLHWTVTGMEVDKKSQFHQIPLCFLLILLFHCLAFLLFLASLSAWLIWLLHAHQVISPPSTTTMKLLSLVACAAAAHAFADTAAFYSSMPLGQSSQKYITDSIQLAEAFTQLTKDFCSSNPTEQLLVYRAAGVAKPAQVGDHAVFLQHVRYASSADLDMPVDASCSVEYTTLDKTESAANVVVIDVDGDSFSIDSVLGARNVIVQGRPTFEKSEVVEPEAAASSVADSVSEALSTLAPARSNLFQTYQFFTPGVWLALIVSVFLIYVASTAVSWITSIQLSYRAFEKQIEFEKKTE